MKFQIMSQQPKMVNTMSGQGVILYTQYFVHPNIERQKEIDLCLTRNCGNIAINEIVNLSETRGKSTGKVTDYYLGRRMTYADVFHHARLSGCTGWIVIANADIYFDNSLANLQWVDPAVPQVFLQLRIESDTGKLFGPRGDSQDAWIFHSTWLARLTTFAKPFHFCLGLPGCDNKVAYLFAMLGLRPLNCPNFIRVIHEHKTQVRNYTKKDTVPGPYLWVCPLFPGVIPYKSLVEYYDNCKLTDFISAELSGGRTFIIPRVAGIENNVAVYRLVHEKQYATMKNNAGICLSDFTSIARYSEQYLQAFTNARAYTAWDAGGEVITASQKYIEGISSGVPLWARALDIFSYLWDIPWTLALSGRTILIISSFAELIESQVLKGVLPYPVDLFPGCKFIYAKPPQTQGKNPSRDWSIEINEFYARLPSVHTYDVALVSAGGYGNIICNYIYLSGGSAIYVGGVLQMYFGIIGERWVRELPDVLTLYQTCDWVRPRIEDRPAGYEEVEASAYW